MSIALIKLRNDITNTALHDLYLSKRLPIRRIAEHLKCDPQTAKRYLLYFSIPLRDRLEAYRCRIVTETSGRLRYPKHDFSGPDTLKAYMIGFRLGDLSVCHSSPGRFCQTIEVKGRTTHQLQISLFRNLFTTYGHIFQSRPDKAGGVHLICYLNRSFDFLVPKQDAVEFWIRTNPQCAVAFSAGYIDAEGSFYITRGRGQLRVGLFAVASQDLCILHWLHRWMRSINIVCQPPKIAIPKGTPRSYSLNKDYWILQVCRKDSLVCLINILKPWIRHTKRKHDMEAILENIKERNHSPNLKFARTAHRRWAESTTL